MIRITPESSVKVTCQSQGAFLGQDVSALRTGLMASCDDQVHFALINSIWFEIQVSPLSDGIHYLNSQAEGDCRMVNLCS